MGSHQRSLRCNITRDQTALPDLISVRLPWTGDAEFHAGSPRGNEQPMLHERFESAWGHQPLIITIPKELTIMPVITTERYVCDKCNVDATEDKHVTVPEAGLIFHLECFRDIRGPKLLSLMSVDDMVVRHGKNERPIYDPIILEHWKSHREEADSTICSPEHQKTDNREAPQ